MVQRRIAATESRNWKYDVAATSKRFVRALQRSSGFPGPRDWARFAGVLTALHLAWEFAQASLFTRFHEQPLASTLLTCAVATVGDVLLSLGGVAAVGIVVHDLGWPFRARRIVRASVWVALGLFATFGLEILAVRIGAWDYTKAMLQFLGVGLAPLFQWIFVPSASLGLGAAPRRSSSEHLRA